MVNPVIDLIIRIKNGYMARKDLIDMPSSKYKEEVLKKLVTLRYIKAYKINGKKISVNLMYKDKKPVMTDIKIFSKPGQKIYSSYKNLKPVLGGLGYTLLSTPKGILTNSEARKEKIGGELLFSIW